MARTARTIWVAAGAVVVLGVAALAGWWFLVRDDAPPEADIDAAGETLDEAATPGSGDHHRRRMDRMPTPRCPRPEGRGRQASQPC